MFPTVVYPKFNVLRFSKLYIVFETFFSQKIEHSAAISRSLLDFGFDDDTLDDLNTCYATLNMFYELDLHSRFAIEKDVSFREQ